MLEQRRLVSFLGLGPLAGQPPYYSSTRYRGPNGALAAATPILQAALLELLGPFDSVIILGTPEAEARWITSGLLARYTPGIDWIARDAPTGVGCEMVRVASAASGEGATWQTFSAIAAAMGAGGGGLQPAAETVVDVTHGFRVQPVIGVAAVSFAISEWARRGEQSMPSIRVVYGAYDARVDDEAPLWDITEIVTAAQWNAALDAFMRFGRADDLERLAVASSKAAVDPASPVSELRAIRRFGETSREFADDVALCRLEHALAGSAPRLTRAVADPALQQWATRFPVLSGALQQLRTTLERLRADPLRGSADLRAVAELARLCGHWQQYAGQVGLLREGLVSLHAEKSSAPPLLRPGAPGFAQQRKGIDESWGTACRSHSHGATGNQPIDQTLSLSTRLGRTRNDILHWGLGGSPSQAHRLRRKLAGYNADFERLASGYAPLAATADPAAGGFANVSNHCLDNWPADQKRAARALGLGEPFDLSEPFPQVPPDATTEEVERDARRLADSIASAGAAGAFVAGEFTFSFALVVALQRLGVRCFSATTERTTTAVESADGSIERRSLFRFVAWREYPQLA